MSNIEIMPTNPKKIESAHKTEYCEDKIYMHIHNNFEIYMSMSDNNKFFVGHKIYDVNRYDIFLFNNSDVHKINPSRPDKYDRYVVMFSPQLFPKSDEELHGLLDCFDANRPNRCHKVSLPEKKRQEVLTVLEKMVETENTEDYHKLLRLKLYLTELLLVINDVQSLPHYNIAPQNFENPRIQEIMEYIRLNCNFPISLEMLSKKFYLNKYYLCRLFKSTTGFGISDYIEACRLSNAIPLLREGVPVSTVALKTGFGSDTYFISTFKKNLGTSPKQYIKNA